MKRFLIFLLAYLTCSGLLAQSGDCVFKKPFITIHFGSGNVRDINAGGQGNYERVSNPCPSDGYYTYTNYTSECHSGDWFTLEDHTPGDNSGNMLLVNSSYTTGVFFKTPVSQLKGGTTYEFGVWIMNVCKITDKCPFPLLPNIVFRLQTPSGKTVAQFGTGEVFRVQAVKWTQYRTVFTMPASETSLMITMINNKPGGCGNDFALDDITFRECVRTPPTVRTIAKNPVVKKEQPPVVKQAPKKTTTAPPKTTTVPVKQAPRVVKTVAPQKDTQVNNAPAIKVKPVNFPAPPPILKTRENTVVKKIETESGEIKINLYDNGEIDGDTISIYHNNVLLISRARLSASPISLSIPVDRDNPHHELVMVAENLGSIPPNTSLMVVTAAGKRYEVFISSNEQRNAKVILDLKE